MFNNRLFSCFNKQKKREENASVSTTPIVQFVEFKSREDLKKWLIGKGICEETAEFAHGKLFDAKFRTSQALLGVEMSSVRMVIQNDAMAKEMVNCFGCPAPRENPYTVAIHESNEAILRFLGVSK